MAKKHVGIGIAAVAASAGATTYMKKKAQKKQKKKQMEIRYSDYQNTERGKQVCVMSKIICEFENKYIQKTGSTI